MAVHLKYKSGSSWIDYNLVVYPVGAYYFSSSSTSPSSLFGGTWEAVTGRFLYMNAGTGTGGSNSASVTTGGGTPYVNVGTFAKNAYEEDTTAGYGLPNKYTGHGSLPFADRPLVAPSPKSRVSGIKASVYGINSSVSTVPAYQTVYAWRRKG